MAAGVVAGGTAAPLVDGVPVGTAGPVLGTAGVPGAVLGAAGVVGDALGVVTVGLGVGEALMQSLPPTGPFHAAISFVPMTAPFGPSGAGP
ncbi:hypothetical protein [Streptomyces sp. H39-S7]|uniref:hypothetical protein n=1 Tax=Streptomyces sp. H39-S7 TaxID=3004357 RepID=UPI0022B0106A|nr:hypothetical protein [Streptomyces sp. H39-S7]MCZ4119841.1 hypothetical protein [Streptomyces sp. H39-S7]